MNKIKVIEQEIVNDTVGNGNEKSEKSELDEVRQDMLNIAKFDIDS